MSEALEREKVKDVYAILVRPYVCEYCNLREKCKRILATDDDEEEDDDGRTGIISLMNSTIRARIAFPTSHSKFLAILPCLAEAE
jgi:hypothetical protein